MSGYGGSRGCARLASGGTPNAASSEYQYLPQILRSPCLLIFFFAELLYNVDCLKPNCTCDRYRLGAITIEPQQTLLDNLRFLPTVTAAVSITRSIVTADDGITVYCTRNYYCILYLLRLACSGNVWTRTVCWQIYTTFELPSTK
jgi:hypothetical protein